MDGDDCPGAADVVGEPVGSAEVKTGAALAELFPKGMARAPLPKIIRLAQRIAVREKSMVYTGRDRRFGIEEPAASCIATIEANQDTQTLVQPLRALRL